MPWLSWGRPAPDLGHWIGSVALDPVRSAHVLYVTGATIWGSDSADEIDNGRPTRWSVRAQGLRRERDPRSRQPAARRAAALRMGDIGGFRHDDLKRVPLPGRALSPIFNTVNHLDFAQHNPEIVVASGNAKVHGAISADGGSSWKLFASQPTGARGAGDIAISSDGKTILWAAQGAPLSRSTDGGATWTPCEGGVPGGARIASDRFLAPNFWAYDGKTGAVYLSTDRGADVLPSGRYRRRRQRGDRHSVGAPHNAWVCAGGGGLFQRTASQDGFQRVGSVDAASHLGFGAPRPGVRYPTLFLNGKVGGAEGIFRSDDVGATWVRLDDASHRYATSNVITGDPRVWAASTWAPTVVEFSTGGRNSV